MNALKARYCFVCVLLLSGCVGYRGSDPATIIERTKPQPREHSTANSGVHVVRKGDTLYSIALEHGLDYRDIARWNDLNDANLIKVGESLRLTAPVATTIQKVDAEVSLKPLKNTNEVIKNPIVIVAYPKGLMLSYNTDLATVSRLSEGVTPAPDEKAIDPQLGTKAPPEKHVLAQAKTSQSKPVEDLQVVNDDEIRWAWPVVGDVVTPFSERSKGIDIAGSMGTSVKAAADGKIVYSGVGLRGYGKLIIIKHNKTYLSAYAHNSKLLLTQGDFVKKGEKIAEMGNTDTDQVKLHFEIRRFGKPVNPSKYLMAEQL